MRFPRTEFFTEYRPQMTAGGKDVDASRRFSKTITNVTISNHEATTTDYKNLLQVKLLGRSPYQLVYSRGLASVHQTRGFLRTTTSTGDI